MEHAEVGKDGEELYPREVGINISGAADASISGEESTVRGSLALESGLRERVTMSEESF